MTLYPGKCGAAIFYDEVDEPTKSDVWRELEERLAKRDE